jgi:hypothetical protein
MIISKRDLEVINCIVKENDISWFKLFQESGSGIGYITDLEFETEINGRVATVKMPVSDEDNW